MILQQREVINTPTVFHVAPVCLSGFHTYHVLRKSTMFTVHRDRKRVPPLFLACRICCRCVDLFKNNRNQIRLLSNPRVFSVSFALWQKKTRCESPRRQSKYDPRRRSSMGVAQRFVIYDLLSPTATLLFGLPSLIPSTTSSSSPTILGISNSFKTRLNTHLAVGQAHLTLVISRL